MSEDEQEERRIIQLDQKNLIELINILDIEAICHVCGKKVDEENIGTVLNKPNRIVCDNILCLTEVAIEDGKWKNKKFDKIEYKE